MRYALLDHLACPACRGPLLCLTQSEIASPMAVGRPSGGRRVASGPGMGPAPVWTTANDWTRALERFASAPADEARGRDVEVDSGILLCACGRWFPIERTIPELLPDHLRNIARDRELVRTTAAGAPDDIRAGIERFQPSSAVHDDGAHYKRAEIAIQTKVEDPMFFVPGESSPFAYWDSGFSVYLIKLFGAAAPLLRLARNDVMVDSGCGYAWTTEWLFRSGFDPIGLDICRTYLDVALRRLPVPRPHLVLGDVEALPLAAGVARAVLAYESLHHVPNRPRAMAEYDRVLGDEGVVILAEPGVAHESAQVSIDAMAKYGILEKGMELEDVRQYAAGTGLEAEQIFLVRVVGDSLGSTLDARFVRDQSSVEGNLFRLIKRGARASSIAPARVPPPRASTVLRVVRRLKAALGM
jgi:uncharacterized protein YbaR (Trm112 family)/SAM-dependent methyltransferase